MRDVILYRYGATGEGATGEGATGEGATGEASEQTPKRPKIESSQEPGAPSRLTSMLSPEAEDHAITVEQLIDKLLEAEKKLEDEMGVDLNELYKMRTDGPATQDGSTNWPSALTEIKERYGIHDPRFDKLFEIKKKPHSSSEAVAYMFANMGGFFNFRNIGTAEFENFRSIVAGDEPVWLSSPGLPADIMRAAIRTFGVIEIVDCAYPNKKIIRSRKELEQLPIRLHKYLTAETPTSFQECSYYARYGFRHVESTTDAWKQMNEYMKDTFDEDTKKSYGNVLHRLSASAEERYTMKDISPFSLDRERIPLNLDAT